jgi:hypothetical protein
LPSGALRLCAKPRSSNPPRTSRALYCTVLHRGMFQLLGLGPELRNIAEILGVGADLLEQPPGRFHRRDVLLALIFAAALAD